MTFTLRPATLADASALSAFASQNFPDAAPAVVPRDAVAAFVAASLNEEAVARYIKTGAYRFTLAVNQEGEIIAYSGIDTREPQPAEVPGKAAYLSKFYVGAEARGTGVSHALMQAVIDEACATGHDGLHLGTHRENYRAQKFYEKNGFVKVGTRQFELAAGICGDDFIYHLPIPKEGMIS
ncbi:MAG: GNAT family N-acetyltransferase [Rothia sp. (in: high G+C Gram-positive bacteria)]|nr:GNAT family N-acetyltransferase [Rothia sp. (in: high G+C Gram-positive bacteria)]